MSTYEIGGRTFYFRLLVGSGKYPSFAVMRDALEASGTEMVTVAVRRVDLEDDSSEGFWAHFDKDRYTMLPNTAGCYDVKSAVTTARLAREATGSDFVKVEVIGDEDTLFPDNEGLLEACRILLDDGFIVLPYCIDDPVICKKLEQLGCHAVMPLAAPIGSGLGIRNPYNLQIIMQQISVPVIVDAGVGTASDAAVAMELGATAVLMQTAIAGADDPVKMARAMNLGVEAGRLAHEAGRIPMKLYATASSPLAGVIGLEIGFAKTLGSLKLDPLYLITDRNAPPSGDLPRALEAAFAGGVRFVQFREKDLPYEERLSLGREVASLTNEHGVRLLVNGDPELAEALGADGVHLGKGTVSVSAVRARGYAGLIGYSAHSGVEAAGAFAQGADFVTLSPGFPHQQQILPSGPLLGLDAFERELTVAGGPVYALGGVGAANASACVERGAHGVSLIGAILGADDPAQAAREVRAALAL